MSPEYAWAGLFSEKSDIYSLGVLMLEIISGKKISRFSFGDGSKGLLAYVSDMFNMIIILSIDMKCIFLSGLGVLVRDWGSESSGSRSH